ncbi:MAG TPA: hypothetical protein VFS39_14055 [Nitrospira sp.]|nr:hypothetical protein [Nitrospira sp.]
MKAGVACHIAARTAQEIQIIDGGTFTEGRFLNPGSERNDLLWLRTIA